LARDGAGPFRLPVPPCAAGATARPYGNCGGKVPKGNARRNSAFASDAPWAHSATRGLTERLGPNHHACADEPGRDVHNGRGQTGCVHRLPVILKREWSLVRGPNDSFAEEG